MNSILSIYRYSFRLRLSYHPLASFSSYNNYRFFKNESFGTVLTQKNIPCHHLFHTTSSIQQHQQLKQIVPNPSKEEQKNSQTLNVESSWILRHIPSQWIPFAQLARMDKPIGTMLLLYPCLWSTALATHPMIAAYPYQQQHQEQTLHLLNQTYSIPTLDTLYAMSTVVGGDPYLIGLFTAGAFVMRGAGCTINDMWDAKYDALVSRTRSRPIASGKVSIYPHATTFLMIQLLTGLYILSSFPTHHLYFCFLVGMSSMPLVITYPLMKRCTNVPQLVLGFTFNWGIFMGWAAVHGSFTGTNTITSSWIHDTLLVSSSQGPIVDGISVIVPLYIGSVAWTLIYDTLYAHQDKADDEKLGLKSTALYFGKDDTRQRKILSSLSLIAGGCWMVSGYQLGLDIDRISMHPMCSLYYVGCLGAMSHLLWQVHTAKFDDVKNLSYRFRSNNTVGAIMLGSCIMGNVGLFF